MASTRAVFGVDTGGTFTDLASFDRRSGALSVAKVPSTPGDPSDAIRTLLAATKGPVGRLVHGTTVATNALLEKKGARVAVVTTRGFRDTLEIGSTRRASPGLFNTKFVKPASLVPRSARVEVDERLGADGSVLRPLEEPALAAALDELEAIRPDVVVVCLLHSYANPQHERMVREAIRRRWPERPVVISSEIVPELREYERFSTTVINGYTLQKMAGYLTRLAGHVKDFGGAELYVMASNGGIMSIGTAAAFPARTILSGPAGGIRGAMLMAQHAGVTDLLTCDMGGTSTDVSLVQDLQPDLVQESMVAGLPLKLPQLDIHTVGAGGGSIAWVDVDRSLQVGPQSAGAVPGPACYGRGGDAATVTDANLYLGRLGTLSLIGGALPLDRELARAALERLAASARYPDIDRLAEGIIQLVVTNMVSALREISLQRGHDPRAFTLLPFGGAGPLHAVEIAREMGMSRILVPRYPGNLSAIGLLSSDIRYDLARTYLVDVDAAGPERLDQLFEALEGEGRALLQRDGFDGKAIRTERAIDMRYRGQAYALSVPVGASLDREALGAAFESLYRKRYGFARPGHGIELVVLRVTAVGQVERPALKPVPAQRDGPAAAVKGRRSVYFNGAWHEDCPVYNRDRLGADALVSGPAVIEEYGSTTAIPPGWQALVDRWGNLRIEA